MIVVLSIAGIVMEKMKSGHILPINPTLIRVMRVMRIARGKQIFRDYSRSSIDKQMIDVERICPKICLRNNDDMSIKN